VSDDTYVLKFTGEDKDLVDKIDKITDRLNKSRELSVKFNRERSAIARQERKEAFDSLSIQEKKAKLTQRQIDLERRLETVRRSGNEKRQAALQLSIVRNRRSLSGVSLLESSAIASSLAEAAAREKSKQSELSAAAAKKLSEAAALERAKDREWARYKNKSAKAAEADARGKLGAQLRGNVSSGASGGGFAGGAMFAAASRFLGPAAIFGALASAARSALRFADETSDLAEQMGITREQVVQITKASGAAGVNVRQVIGGLSTLSAARSSALGGDVKAQALFSRYGANASEDNILTLAQQIAGSLGPGGMGAKDRGAMGQLFGRRPEGTLAALRSIQSVGNVEDDLRKLDEANAKIEGFWNSVKMAMVKTGAAIIDAGAYAMKIDRETTGTLGGRGGIGFGTFTPAVKGFVGGAGFGAKRRAEDTVLTPASAVAAAAKTMPQIMGSIPQADSLARMGLYIGGGPNSTAGIMKQQLTELKAIKASSQQTVQNISKI
jgi:hypothetical protein